MKRPRRRLELGFINISAVSWLRYENLTRSCCSRGQRDLIQHNMRFFCSSFFFRLFFFFCVAAKSPTFYTDIRILVLHVNHNHVHVVCIPLPPPPPPPNTHKLHTYHAYCKHIKVTALSFCTVRKTNAQSFQASLHLCTNYKRALIGWSGGVKMLGKLSVPGRPTNLDNSRGKDLLRL